MNKSYTLPRGFYSSGICGGIKKNKKYDMGLIFSAAPCVNASFFTKNKLVAAHIILDKKNIKNPVTAVFANSGNANALNGPQGLKDIKTITAGIAKMLSVPAGSVLAASTGKISKKMDTAVIMKALPQLYSKLSNRDKNFPKAIMTTDLTVKTAAAVVDLDGKKCTITGAAKGSGMIAPDMATMLAFLMTDAAITPALLKQAGREAIEGSFNRITVDGDMSPNDTVIILANGMAGNKTIKTKSSAYNKIAAAIKKICYELAEAMVYDGEGATKFIKIQIEKAASEKQAKAVALKVANSALVKTMFFGQSMNPGRIISAVGSTLENIRIDKVVMKYNGIPIIASGEIIEASIKKARKELKKRRIDVTLTLNAGSKKGFILTTDFSYDYVRINADYS